jgi:hypothetical protein
MARNLQLNILKVFDDVFPQWTALRESLEHSDRQFDSRWLDPSADHESFLLPGGFWIQRARSK